MLAEQQLRQLAHPVGVQAAADPLARDERARRALRSRICASVSGSGRDRAARRSAGRARCAADPRRSSSATPCAAGAPRGPSCPPYGSTSTPSARRRAIALIVKSRRARSSSTGAAGSTTISKSCRPGPVETSRRGGASSIPAGHERAQRAVARVVAHADAAARRRRAPRSGRAARSSRAQALDVDTGHEEVGVLRVDAEQLVAHGTADHVGVEPERADVLLDLLRRLRSPRSRRARRTGASRPRPSSAPAASRRRTSRRPRSSRRSRRGSAGTRSS